MHPNAKTDKKMRSYIQNTTKTTSELAEELGVSRVTIRKWKNRTTIEDKSHAVNNLSNILDRYEESTIIFLREFLNLSLDDMLIIAKKLFGFNISRSSLGRLVKRKKAEFSSMKKYNTKNCIKILIVKPKNINSDFVYILSANTKTKVFHISWAIRTNRQEIFNQLCKAIIYYGNKRVLFSRESSDYKFYLTNLENIFAKQNVAFEIYSEASLQGISTETLVNDFIQVIVKLEKIKNNEVNLALRAFRFIYNHKTPLRSLRQKTPKHLPATN